MRKTTLFLLVVACLAVATGDALKGVQQVLTRLVKRQVANNTAPIPNALPPLEHITGEDCGGSPPAPPAPPGGGGGPAPAGNFDEDGMGSYQNNYGYGYKGNKWGSEYRNRQNKYGYELD